MAATNNGPIFERGSAALRSTHLALATVDVVTVCGVIAIGVGRGRHGVAPSAALAVAMWCWHRLENVVWPRRCEVRNAPLYPSGMVWIHVAYSAGLCVGLAEAIGASHFPSLGARWQVTGLALFGAGTALRLWAFWTLGAGFLAAPKPAAGNSHEGPYRWCRHPASWGFLAIALGSTLALGSAWGFCTALLVCTTALRYVNLRERRERAPDAVLSPTRVAA